MAKVDLFGHVSTPLVRKDRERILEDRRRARLITARFARDREDCRFLLDVLGLLPGQEPGALDSTVPAPFVS